MYSFTPAQKNPADHGYKYWKVSWKEEPGEDDVSIDFCNEEELEKLRKGAAMQLKKEERKRVNRKKGDSDE